MTEFVLTQDALNLYSILIIKKKIYDEILYMFLLKKKKKKKILYMF